MGVQMIYCYERFLPEKAQCLGGSYADHKSDRQTRLIGDGDRINIVFGNAGL